MITQAGDPALYSRMHRKVRKLRGPASAQLCVRCIENGADKQAHDWAQVHTEDGLDPWADYVPLCRSCHEIYDGKNTGRVISGDTRSKISAARKGQKIRPEHAEALHNGRRGSKNTPEHNAAISAGRTGKRNTPETKAKMSAIARETQKNRARDSLGRYT
jgi:hypothetical protein